MTQKYVSVLALALAGAATAFAQVTLNSVPSRSIGSPNLNISSLSPNLVEGREFWNPQGVALDTSGSTPILYVSDTNNNRVLAWKNAKTFTNGQPADLAIGQPDLLTTFVAGPNSPVGSPGHNTSGLYAPTGIAVDAQGNLYVADSGNNRILRYPKPFQSSTQYPLPDLWIGQTGSSPSTGTAHCGSSQVTSQGLCLAPGSGTYQAGLAFDTSGNLWVTDAGNARVLRFPAAQLAAGGGGLTADIAIGQPNTATVQTALPYSSTSLLSLTQFFTPGTLGFDSNGNLFVTDIDRVLVFQPQFASGMSASPHVIGVAAASYSLPTGAALQQFIDQTAVYNPEGLFFPADGTIGVVDAGATISSVSVGNRIMVFPALASWPNTGAPPSANLILGQPAACAQFPSQLCKAINNGSPWPAGNTCANPTGVAWNATDLFIADTGNNRVLDFALPLTAQSAAARVLGQDLHNGNFDTNSIDLIEGREFQFQNVLSNQAGDSGIAIDSTGAVPHLYVSDAGNNRVLGFKDLRNLKPGAKADIVIGQPDMQTAMCNYHAPADSSTGPTKNNLCRPVGLAVDPAGNLYVADSLNGRVLRFPAPFGPNGSNGEAADLVLGQQNFTTTIPDVTATNMALPYGLAFTPACNPQLGSCSPNGLVVSDESDNRVLYIPMTNGVFTAGADNGKAATVVFGQTGFNSAKTGTDPTSLNLPHHVACDSSGLVYVADTGNNRVLVFNDPSNVSTPQAGAQGFPITNLNAPQGVFVSPSTGEIWVANTGSANAVHYSSYSLLGNGPLPDSIVELSGGYSLRTLALAQDQYGALYVADQADRLAFYYPGLNVCNGATFMAASPSEAPNLCAPFDFSNGQTLNAHPLAPGVLASIFPCGQFQYSSTGQLLLSSTGQPIPSRNCAGDQFGDQTSAWDGITYPMPMAMNDIQVLFDGVPTPLYYVGAPIPNTVHTMGQINFVVPNGARTSASAAVQVVRASTGQVLGAALVPMASASPGILVCGNWPNFLNDPGAVTRNACVRNQDNTVNSPSNPAQRGKYISIYATGQGYVPNAPTDGNAPSGPLSVPAPLTVVINNIDVNDASRNGGENFQHIEYSGLDQFPGVWQINVQIPNGIPPSNQSGGSTPLNLEVGGTVANVDLGEGVCYNGLSAGQIVNGVCQSPAQFVHWNTVVYVK